MTDSAAASAEAGASDGVLVRRVAEGDAEALGALFDRYGARAFALAVGMTGRAALAEDVVHGVFLGLWRESARYDPARGGFPGWLLAATHHAALRATREEQTARRGREALAEEAARRARPEVVPAGADGRTCRALGALPAPQRQALILAYFAGQTQREIAAATAEPVDTIGFRLLTGMRELRDLLDGSPAPATALEPARVADVPEVEP